MTGGITVSNGAETVVPVLGTDEFTRDTVRLLSPIPSTTNSLLIYLGPLFPVRQTPGSD